MKDYYMIDVCRRKIKAKRIGGGSWTEAYWSGRYVYLITNDEDMSKSFLAELPKMRHLPEIKYMGRNKNNKKVYRTKYYKPLDETSPAWKYYLILYSVIGWSYSPSRHGFKIIDRLIERNLPDSIIEAIKAIIEKVIDKDYNIEISDYNLGVDKNGDLILLDLPYPCL
jgi:hypothetical protein